MKDRQGNEDLLDLKAVQVRRVLVVVWAFKVFRVQQVNEDPLVAVVPKAKPGNGGQQAGQDLEDPKDHQDRLVQSVQDVVL